MPRSAAMQAYSEAMVLVMAASMAQGFPLACSQAVLCSMSSVCFCHMAMSATEC